MASPSSSKPRNSLFHVFCSFHGPDVGKTFLSHLREQFQGKGITMFNDEKIKRGGDLSPSLKEVIKESRISIVILSKKYASSSWCLDELVEILKNKKAMKQIVMTVFYGVEPSDVRKQTGDFGIAFDETCAIKTDKEVLEWSKALTDVSNIAGEDFKKWDNEANMIKKITRDVLDQLNATPSKDFEDMVGLETHLRKMESLLDLDDVGVKIVAIFGPAGIGKTTIARALQSLLSNMFQLTCFVDNLRRSYHSGFDEYGLKLHLQEQFLSKVLNQSGMRICHLGAVKEYLSVQRVLIILDDVNNLKQLEALANEPTWFGPGSRIVVTTENKELLQQHGIKNTYHVEFPSDQEALKILYRYAFRQISPPHGFKKLAETVIKLCGNLPLGLCVVGSSLRGKKEDEWEHVVSRLETIFDRDIEELLRVGYESLDENEQTLFLHIAVFFNNINVDLMKTSFADSDLDVNYGLKILENRSLIEISTYGDQIVMHRLLQQVGKKAIHEQEPWKRQILIDAHGISDVLEDAKVIHLRLDLPKSDKTANKILSKVRKIPGVSSVTVATVSRDGDWQITVTGTVDPETLQNKLRNYRPMLEKVVLRKKHDSDEEGGSEKSKKGNDKFVLDEEFPCVDTYSGEMLSTTSISEPSEEGSEGFDSGDNITVIADKSTTKAPDRKHLNNDWYSFCHFCRNRRPPSSPYGCSADDVIDFLRTQHVSGGIEALVDRLGFTIEALGIKPEDNPFRSPAVTSYLKTAREMTQETECILVFSCNDNLDVDETSFIEAISKELHKREVTPLTYNLLGREKLDEEMLYRSRVGIMILSNSYVSSRQSLDQLVAVMEHWKTTDLVIIPIYFKVTVSEICGLKGKFEAAFLQLQRSLQEDRFQKWKAAVTEIVSIGGLEWTKGSQFMLAEEVVRNASLRLHLKNSKNLAEIIALLNPSQSLDAEIVGLWGMAGIGKTSIAREIFEIRAPHYDSCYFLQDFHLMCQMKGLTQLRDDFLSKVFGEEKLSIGACDTKLSFMKAWFHNKKILVVLDDVSNARDAEAVVGGFGWFSHGHTIILTSRRKQVLVQCKVKELYEIQKLCEFESFRLCKQYLNGENVVISELMSCSSGIPLALKVLVSSVSKQHIKNMKEHLQSLRKNPPAQIQEAFRRSFNGLDENEKNIFLDLACFFRGENKDHVVQILDACGFFACLGICDLIDESLISLLENGIEMPIPFQDIGRFVVREEDEDPCERSRLWDSSDITDVLINNSGTEAIEGIFLDASDLTCELSPTVFGKMYNLRLLKFYCSTSGNECKLNLPQGLDTLPDELRLLHWENYPLENLPGKFNPENLVEINMPYSNMEKLWEGKKNLEKLKILKLSHSTKLTDIQVLSEAMNLEHIDLEGCTSLVDVSTSIPCCGKLVSLNMKDCSHLRSLPAMVDFTSLKLVNFSGCSELKEIQESHQT